MIELDDTIAALSSSPGSAGVAVVKISGPDSFRAAKTVFSAKGKSSWEPRKMILGYVMDQQGEMVDQALAVFMPGPNSYTRQDVVEIQTHGGQAISSILLDLLAMQGVRMAAPGEFTRRAFLLGRMDLAQAEAVLDIVSAKTKAGLVAAQRQLSGVLSERIIQLREALTTGTAHLEANIEFPDQEIGDLDYDLVGEIFKKVELDIQALLKTYTSGRLFTHGALCVIAGRPNVGKSSLLNRLLKKKRAIVTDTPGTTRDAVEDFANIGGAPFRLVDTAGLRDAADPIEGEGVKIAREQIDQADLVILLADADASILPEDLILLEELKNKRPLLVLNKIDLVTNQIAKEVATEFGEKVVRISAKTGQGIDELKQRMLRAAQGDQPLVTNEAVLTNARHKQSLEKGLEFLQSAQQGLKGRLSPELVALDVTDAFQALGEIIGESTPDDVLDVIFSQFCIGK